MQFLKLEAAHPVQIILSVFFLLFVAVPLVHAAPGDETTYYLLTDHLGSVDVILDDQGEVIERRDYLPYGAERVNESASGATKTDHKFTGKELDDQTGLHYYGARYYDAEIGRFISIDPLVLDEASSSNTELIDILGNPQLLNAYSYAANNPINTIDPTGEESQKALVTAAITGLAVTYQYAERAGNGLGFLYEIYIGGDYDQAVEYARAYDENSGDLGKTIYLSAKKIANDLVPLSGTALSKLVEEDIFVDDFKLEDAVLNSSADSTNVDTEARTNYEGNQSDENSSNASEDLGYNDNVEPEGDEGE